MEKVANSNSETTFYNLRFERKFVFENAFLEDLIQGKVFSNSFMFEEIFERRTINNIYYDDRNLTFYKQNVSGDGLRIKYRIRWYGDDFCEVTKPTLEIKKKFGTAGDKYSYKIPNLAFSLKNLTPEMAHQKSLEAIKDEVLANKFENLIPTLYNSYERRYFLSHCEKYRITLDYNMKFYNPHYKNFIENECFVENNDIVLELKYATEDDDESRELSQQLKTRLSKNSKYVRGIDLIYV